VLGAVNGSESLYPGQLDWTAFFMDDGTFAGTREAVGWTVSTLCQSLGDLGLEPNLTKSEVLFTREEPPGDLGLLEGLQVNREGDFKLLGAAFGASAYQTSLNIKRGSKGSNILGKAATLASAQKALLLIRHCAGYAKLVYSTRVTPPREDVTGFREYEDALRGAVQEVLGAEVGDREWKLATLGIKRGRFRAEVTGHPLGGGLHRVLPSCREPSVQDRPHVRP